MTGDWVCWMLARKGSEGVACALTSDVWPLALAVSITWEDAPEEQFPILHKDFKVRCKVTAQPAPQVDWMRNGEIISTGGRHVVETDGLTIQRPAESDDGVYTCRAIVVQTGELAQRDIRVEVHTPPTFEDMLPSTKIVEGETATIRCRARGKPKPTFAWIKASTQQNMAQADRFNVNPLTGDMIITGVSGCWLLAAGFTLGLFLLSQKIRGGGAVQALCAKRCVIFSSVQRKTASQRAPCSL